MNQSTDSLSSDQEKYSTLLENCRMVVIGDGAQIVLNENHYYSQGEIKFENPEILDKREDGRQRIEITLPNYIVKDILEHPGILQQAIRTSIDVLAMGLRISTQEIEVVQTIIASIKLMVRMPTDAAVRLVTGNISFDRFISYREIDDLKQEIRMRNLWGAMKVRFIQEKLFKKAGLPVSQVVFIAEDLNFLGVNLKGADLRDANLRGVRLEGVNLSEADLTRAHLEGAYLQSVNILNADLRQAYLGGVRAFDTKLSDALVTVEQINQVNLLAGPTTKDTQ